LELNKIYLGDCLDILPSIPDKSINLIVIDPPYNIGKDKSLDKWKSVNLYVEFMGKVFAECQRVLKDNGSFYFFHNDFLHNERNVILPLDLPRLNSPQLLHKKLSF